jgi:putative tricarboxylic transport membrane protein
MWIEGFLTALNFNYVLWLILGTLWGLFIGVLPALGPNFAVAIMLPFTYGMDTASALIFLCAAHASCNYGDSLASILVNIPGGPGTVATCWDGYPMARQGKATRALGIATFASFTGGAITWLSLVLLAKPIGEMAMAIGAPEYFALGVMALGLVSVAGRGETLKGVIMACVGLLLAAVGQDPVTGVTSRFSFGIMWLEAGIPIVVSTLGIFAISQIISLLEEKSVIYEATTGLKGTIFSGFLDVFRRPLTLIRAGFVGWFIGILPALGVSLAGISSYLVEKKYSKEKEDFGKGCPGGVVAAEVGKGACVVGDLIPTFTLGIPGSVTGAILMAALIIHGIEPGPRFLLSGLLPYIVFSGLLLAQLAYLVLGPMFCKLLARVIFLPNAILVPFITFLSFLGAYTERNYTSDLLLMVVFGILAYVLEKLGYSVICVVLGLILGDLVEANLGRSIQIGFGSAAIFLERPIALILLGITLLFLVGPYFLSLLGFRGLSIGGKESAVTRESKVNFGEVLSLIFIGLFMVMFIVIASAYKPLVRLFPDAVAVIGLLCILLRLSYWARIAIKNRGYKEITSPAAEVKERPVVRYQISMALLIGYGVLVYIFGFVATTCMFIILTAYIAGYRKPIGLGAMAVGAGITTLVFAKILNILLPVGMIYSALFY